MDVNLTGRVALVTGAASGIGAAAVGALARAGYDVVINYSRSAGPAREVAAQAQKLGAHHVDKAGPREQQHQAKKPPEIRQIGRAHV